jgi:MraZ protein
MEPTRPDVAAKDRDEPPLAPTPGPVMKYKVPAGETFKTLARKMLGSAERWTDIHKLNPTLRADAAIPAGTVVRLPGDACVTDDHDPVRALPSLRARTAPKARAVMPLTGTFPVALDDHKVMTLPGKILEQLGNCDTVLLSPGSDRCLWLTNQAHLDRLQAKLDKSPARESDVRSFKRLYYAQTVKVPVKDGRLAITDKLAGFAGLGVELVLVGIDDHFEIWDAAKWRRYTQTKKASSTED